MSYWETINNDLSGQNGFVYLMFVGRETIGKIIVEDITTSKFQILAVPKDQVYAAISFLEKKKHIRQIRKEGRSKIRTAILEPIVESFQHFNWEFNEDAIKVIGKYMSYFPEYSKYSWQIADKPLADILGKTPEEWKEFQKFINSTILKTFKKENG